MHAITLGNDFTPDGALICFWMDSDFKCVAMDLIFFRVNGGEHPHLISIDWGLLEAKVCRTFTFSAAGGNEDRACAVAVEAGTPVSSCRR